MEIPEAISKRKSIRVFTDEELSSTYIEVLVRAGCQAPSAGNLQPWGFVVVRDKTVKEKLVEASYGQNSVITAPMVIVVCTEPARTAPRYGERGTTLYCLQDTAAAVENILLTAAQNGLGTCWIGAFDEGIAARAIGLPEGIRPVAMIPVGHPAQTPQPRSRRPLSEVLHWDRW